MKRAVFGLLLAACAPVSAQSREDGRERTCPRGEGPRDEDPRPDRRLDGDGERLARPDGVFPRREGQVFPPARAQRRKARDRGRRHPCDHAPAPA